MSFFNQSNPLYSGLPITSGSLADTSSYDGLHDPETGRDVRYHSMGQRRSYLARHPNIDPSTLPPVADPNRALPWDDCSRVGGEPANLARKYERRAEQAALLRDPLPTRKAPTKPAKPAPREHDSERAVAVAYHEAAHCCAARLLGLRVQSATILPDPDGKSDGKTMIQSADKHLDAAVLLAGQVGDELSGVPMSSDNYESDNRDAGGSLEYREALKAKMRQYLTEAHGAFMEIARQLIAKKTMNEIEIEAAFVRGLRNARPASLSPPSQRKVRQLSEAEIEERFGKGRIGYTEGYIVDGSLR